MALQVVNWLENTRNFFLKIISAFFDFKKVVTLVLHGFQKYRQSSEIESKIIFGDLVIENILVAMGRRGGA